MQADLTGQIFDGQARLHYNYFRDYDPATGKYVESDPVGLRGGVNTYAYVGNKPLRKSDPLGLFTSDQHAAITYDILVEEPNLIPCITEFLTGVVGLDFVAGSQTIPYAYLHAMAQPGQSAAQAAEQSNQFVFDQINKCDCKALGYALHTVQDSAAWGHQYKTYDGSVSLLHLFTDYDPSSDRITEATVKSKNVISEYKSHCLGCAK